MWLWIALVASIFVNHIVPAWSLTSRSYNSGRGNHKKLIYIGGLLPNVSNIFGSIESAIRDINNSPSLLPNYQLQFIFAETTECDVSRGFQSYLDFVDTLPRKLLLLTGLCADLIRTIDREARTPRGNARSFQISYSNADPSFDSSFQSSLFRLLPSETSFSSPRTLLVQELTSSNHDRIGLIYQNIPKYSAAHEEQVNQLIQQNFVRIESEGFEDSITEFELRALLRRLKDRNVGLILGNFNPIRARQIFCLAYKEGMYGNKYTWILAGNFESNWWRSSEEDFECSTSEMERVLDGMIRVDILPYNGNLVDTKFEDHVSFHRGIRNSKFDGYVYDALWSMAYALQNVSYYYAKLSQFAPPAIGDDYLANSTITFQNPVWEEALHQALADISFLGVTGPVSFNLKQGRVGYSLLVKQFQSTAASGYDEVNVGEFESPSNKLNLLKFPHRIIKRKSRSEVLAVSKPKLEEVHHQPPKHNEEFADEASHNSGTLTSNSCHYVGNWHTVNLSLFFIVIFKFRLLSNASAYSQQ